MITKPIIFSTPMIQAILNGRKTQTRRVLKPQPEGKVDRDCEGNYGEIYGGGVILMKPHYEPNDLLWVREVWRYCEDANGYCYKASQPYVADNCQKYTSVCAHSPKWRSPIHMPKAAARIWLRVTGVRVERIKDISRQDALDEGIKISKMFDYCPEGWMFGCYNGDECYYGRCMRPVELFEELWDSLYKKDGFNWESNPWVFVYEFERIEQPEG